MTPWHMHNLRDQWEPSVWPIVILGQSQAMHKYLGRSVFVLAPLHPSANLCSSNELKVIQILVSNVQYLF